MTRTRLVLGAVGVVAGGYGLLLLVGLGPRQVLSALVWVAGGVVGHDAVLAPLVVALGVLAAVHAPSAARVPLLWALVVLGPLTLVSVPVLGRFGARPDNPTLLDRPYWAGYVVVVLVVSVATAAGIARARHPKLEDDHPTEGL